MRSLHFFLQPSDVNHLLVLSVKFNKYMDTKSLLLLLQLPAVFQANTDQQLPSW